MQTSAVGDTAVADWRFQVPSETSNIRVSMYVNPMSRAVVYFVQLADLAEGNTDALPFVESIVPGEEAAEPARRPRPKPRLPLTPPQPQRVKPPLAPIPQRIPA